MDKASFNSNTRTNRASKANSTKATDSRKRKVSGIAYEIQNKLYKIDLDKCARKIAEILNK